MSKSSVSSCTLADLSALDRGPLLVHQFPAAIFCEHGDADVHVDAACVCRLIVAGKFAVQVHRGEAISHAVAFVSGLSSADASLLLNGEVCVVLSIGLDGLNPFTDQYRQSQARA